MVSCHLKLLNTYHDVHGVKCFDMSKSVTMLEWGCFFKSMKRNKMKAMRTFLIVITKLFELTYNDNDMETTIYCH